MVLRYRTIQGLTEEDAWADFKYQHCVILKGVIDPTTVRRAYELFGNLMGDQEQLAQYPYSKERRRGYKPPGIESQPRSDGKRDFSRHMFDYDPEIGFGEPVVPNLYANAERVCISVLRILDSYTGKSVAYVPRGTHTMRTAQSLLTGTSPKEVLFGEHFDFSLLTAFIGSGVAGLEIFVGGEWHRVEMGFGDVLIGAGTPLKQFYKGLKAVLHRVTGGVDYRLSEFLFYELDYDVVLPSSMEKYGVMLARKMGDIEGNRLDT